MRARRDSIATKASPGSPMARILVLVENLSVPFDRRVWQECQTLREAGHDVVVVCPCGSEQDRERRVRLEDVDIHRYPLRSATGGAFGYLSEYPVALWHSLRLTLRVQRRGRVDVVHICNPPDLFFLCALPLKLAGARVVFDQHDLVPELFLSRFGGSNRILYRLCLLLERVTYRVANHVLATNESYRAIALRRGGLRADEVTVVRSAPDLSRFKLVDPDAELRRGKRYLLCYVGVMGPQDGVDYALRAIAHLRHELGRSDFHAAFVGGGDVFENAVRLAHDLGLDGVVEFTGRISDEALARYLSTADICLAPDPKNPLNDISSMNKIVEYMAMSRPIVAFDLTEGRISAGDAALYARPNDTHDFAAAIATLLDDPERRASMAAYGSARVANELSWKNSAANLLTAYDRVLEANLQATM
ncbi:MAG: glycosyltransferase WbuB [Candidatus Rokuibacteriota bacterium]|nr:MAG: glycosyltransferase WbuB [Candidatus Rokubacteria bacterium]